MTAWLHDAGAGLPYRVLLPLDYRPAQQRYPLVVFLHGSGEAGDDNAAQLKNGVERLAEPEQQRRWPCVVVAPQAPRGDTFGGCWYGGPSPTQARVAQLVRELAGRRSIDPGRVYGVGFSMGAIGLWDMLVRFPGLFTAAVPIAGDLDVARDARALAPLPIWAFHGEHDAAVSPAADRAFAAWCQANGGRARYTELPGRAHGIGSTVLGLPELLTWLFAQRTEPPAQ